VVAGCTTKGSGSGSSSVIATGHTLYVYLSEPPGSLSAGAQAVLSAEQKACSDHRSDVTQFNVVCTTVHESTLSSNARAAIQNKSAIAYIGEIAPALSEQSVGITNALDLLQVSPLDTALELTRTTPAVSGAPNKYYQSLSTYGRTFARVVPNTAAEAKAQVAQMAALKVKSVYVTDDGSDYGKAIAAAVRQDLPSASLTASASESGADAVFEGATSATAAVKVFGAAPSGAKLFAPSALADAAFASAVSSPVYVSAPGSAHGSATAFATEAVTAVFSVLAKAGASANNRATVVRDFFGIKNRASPIGTYSIDANGDTSLTSFSFYRASGGALVPVKSAP
jgi:branched-chain amino acid transport system substrate-binding protein